MRTQEYTNNKTSPRNPYEWGPIRKSLTMRWYFMYKRRKILAFFVSNIGLLIKNLEYSQWKSDEKCFYEMIWWD